MEKDYNFAKIENKWRSKWQKSEIFKSRSDRKQKKFSVLEMFPYPSGKLHMGHVRNYSIGDVIARTRRAMGFNVLYPMGWDAFGLPAENAAINANVHPAEWTYKNIDQMRSQLKALGYSYDWSREIATCHPQYFRWEQQVFQEMYDRGLAYRDSSFVNWCDSCNTVLANEQVENGQCWRCSSEVRQKELVQWFFKITDYTEELLQDLEHLEGGWPDKVLTMQRNWIGKSHGALIKFKLEKSLADWEEIEVFTTRPDTLFGVTFMSIAPEHPLALKLAAGTSQEEKVTAFVNKVRNEDKIQRTSDDYEKEGVFTGKYVINPVNNKKIPVYIGNFVLMDYGTGAVMAVPAHDQRDFYFARKYELPIEVVIKGEDTPLEGSKLEEAYVESGVMVNSGKFDGLNNEEGKEAVIKHLVELNKGDHTVNYRLRDWGISRQRYWGSPIPMIYCDKCGVVKVPLADLPVTLPDDVNWEDHKSGSPLASHPAWKNTQCPQCGSPARRDTDTMDTFVESSWYFLRYTSPRYQESIFNKEDAEYWMGVDQYIGGVEHAVMHLLYARFFTKVLRDLGYIDLDEPFKRLLTQGMVTMETYKCPDHGWLFPDQVTDNNKCVICQNSIEIGRVEKMSKSKKNVVDPLEYIEKYGADTIRFFMLSDSPPDRDLEWSDSGVEGAHKFIRKVWRVVTENLELCQKYKAAVESGIEGKSEIRKIAHASLKKVSEDIERFHFNTALAEIRVLFNSLGTFKASGKLEEKHIVEAICFGLQMIAPFTPHVAEELWKMIGENEFVTNYPWPKYQEKILKEDTFELVVQINGKVRQKIEASADLDKEGIKKLIIDDDKVKTYMEGKNLVKFIYVPGRLANLVLK
ncbi:MAG: leucine--tRNA ligase [Deltaproteobacteria bacterium]|nr:leucine--tRNA ligase [Deltaproteobacteria bacterium]